MTGKEYLESQVKPLGFNDSISLLQFPEEEFYRCPFCGEKMQQTFNGDNNAFNIWCTCDGYKDEVRNTAYLKMLKEQFDEAKSKYDEYRKQVENVAIECGIKIAAQHYMSLKSERDKFDSEIEQLAK